MWQDDARGDDVASLLQRLQSRGVSTVLLNYRDDTPVVLDLSEERLSQKFIEEVHATIREHGYVKIAIRSYEIKENVLRVFEGTRRFFALAPSTKAQYMVPGFTSLEKNENVGHAGEEEPQLFSVRTSNSIAFPWPEAEGDPQPSDIEPNDVNNNDKNDKKVRSEGKDKETEKEKSIANVQLTWEAWRNSIENYFGLMEDLARLFLGFLALGMRVDPAVLAEQLLETYPIPHGTFGRSNLLINHFDYEKAPTRDPDILRTLGSVAMEEHTDKGLVTVIPCSDVPALQALDQSTGEWLDVECEHGVFGEGIDNHFLIFTGDMLAQATAAYYRPLNHRVPEREWKTRVSLPFQLRARHDAMLPPPVLVPALVPPVSSIYRHPVRVDKFLSRPPSSTWSKKT